ncbi:MAG: tetratricopeptide repeat protein [Chitinophagaceae bacterium]|nr:tetratricopeptide repeat protein [Chitinophagaceae bacterium]
MKICKVLNTVLVIGLLLLFSSVAKAQGLKGRYRFVEDGDGKQPNAKAVIMINFSGSTFTFKAEQPGEVVTDNGTYQISGNKLAIKFKEMEQGQKSGTYSLQSGILTLPFKMLDNEKGTSKWQDASLIPVNKTTVKEVIAKAIEGSDKKAKLYADLDQRAIKGNKNLRGGLAESYYVQATFFYFKNYKWEALYGYAKACNFEQSNALYLNNLCNLLLELGRIYDAKVLAEEITARFPNLPYGWNNLAFIYLKLGIVKEADKAIKIAMKLAPENGLYCYTGSKIAEEEGRKTEAEKLVQQAWDLGYAGNGREGAGGTAAGKAGNNNATKGNKNAGTVKPSAKPKQANKPPSGYKIADWQGSYQAKYISARSGETATEANTKFGEGVASTVMNLQTLACVKSFSMQISPGGSISGSGEILYVYQGTTANMAVGMAPSVLTGNGFSANLKDGYQVRSWSFTGTVNDNGDVEIKGLPSEKLDLLNVGKWQKITPWSPLPPDAAGAAMKGPFHLKLAMSDKKEPFIYIDQYLELNDKLIKKVHYTGLIIKSDEAITPDCKPIEPPPAADCPASEFIKTKVSFNPRDHIAIENSTTYSKGADGQTQAQTEMATNISGEWNYGMATGSAEFHMDGSYEFTVGIGVEAGLFGKDGPLKISEKIELIYDSKCGWGIKGSASAGAEGFGTKAGASVEGVIFFNKGM